MAGEHRVSCCRLVVDTDDVSGDIDRLFMNVWWEMNWLCGRSSALHVGAAAHNHVRCDWQVAVFSRLVLFKRDCFRLHQSNSLLYVLGTLGDRPTDWTVGAVWFETHKGIKKSLQLDSFVNNWSAFCVNHLFTSAAVTLVLDWVRQIRQWFFTVWFIIYKLKN